MKKISYLILLISILFIFLFVGYGLWVWDEVKAFKNPKYSKVITVYDWNKKGYPFVLGPKNINFVYWRNINQYIKWAVILSEDAKFYRHSGIDYEAMKQALKKNVEMGKYVRGGSTITQQLAKNVFLSREKTITRKLKEVVIALIIEYELSKTRILELYLNTVEFGPLVYGIGHASHFYFGKSTFLLNPLESALLAALLPGPKIFNPYRNLDKVEVRAKNILKKMLQIKLISESEYEKYVNSSLTIGLERKIEVKMKEEPKNFENISSTKTFSNISTEH